MSLLMKPKGNEIIQVFLNVLDKGRKTRMSYRRLRFSVLTHLNVSLNVFLLCRSGTGAA